MIKYDEIAMLFNINNSSYQIFQSKINNFHRDTWFQIMSNNPLYMIEHFFFIHRWDPNSFYQSRSEKTWKFWQ